MPRALGDDVGQMAMRLGAVLHGLAQLRAGGRAPTTSPPPS